MMTSRLSLMPYPEWGTGSQPADSPLAVLHSMFFIVSCTMNASRSLLPDGVSVSRLSQSVSLVYPLYYT